MFCAELPKKAAMWVKFFQEIRMLSRITAECKVIWFLLDPEMKGLVYFLAEQSQNEKVGEKDSNSE